MLRCQDDLYLCHRADSIPLLFNCDGPSSKLMKCLDLDIFI